jgi:hypothetical protein
VFKIKEQKGFFPYDYMNDFNVLHETKLPHYNNFFSKIKNHNVLEHDFDTWRQQNKGAFCTLTDDQNRGILNIQSSIDYLDLSGYDHSIAHPPKLGIENYLDLLNLWKRKNIKIF